MILSFFAFLFRVALLAVFTFAFVVLFEHGTQNYAAGALKEWDALLATAQQMVASR